MTDLDDDDIEELAELYGVSTDEVEAYLAEQEEREELRDLARDEAEAEFEEAEAQADEAEELAELYGGEPGEVEALFDAIGDDARAHGEGLTQDELRDYIDDLYEQLTAEGFDLDVSDLWDMYYGYTPQAA